MLSSDPRRLLDSPSVVDQDRVQRLLLLFQLPPAHNEDGVVGLGEPEQEARRRDGRHRQPVGGDGVVLQRRDTDTYVNVSTVAWKVTLGAILTCRK